MAGELPVNSDVEKSVAAIEDPGRQEDSRRFIEIMAEITGEPPRLWDSNIIGFGSYEYRYASGREGEGGKIGIAPRTANLTIYLLSGLVAYDDLLSKLGKFKSGKSTIYLNRLDDVDREVFAELLTRSVRHVDQVIEEMGGLPRMSEMPPFREE